MIKPDIKFDLCISNDYLIDFVEKNTGWDWNDICDMEYKYRHSDSCDYAEFYPLVDLGEENEDTFQYWIDRFIETYKEETNGTQIYVVID